MSKLFSRVTFSLVALTSLVVLFQNCAGDMTGLKFGGGSSSVQVNEVSPGRISALSAPALQNLSVGARIMQDLKWSFAGTLAGQTCVKINEPADPHAWDDNFLCGSQDWGLQWSYAGPINGMTCTQFFEAADPDTWYDNYLCAPQDYGLKWSSAGPIAGLQCLKIDEPSDPYTWDDNYLCGPANSVTASQPSGNVSRTAYPDFTNVCSKWVTGLQPLQLAGDSGVRLYPSFGLPQGNCDGNANPILFSTTHENEQNTHAGAANNQESIVAYMGDVDATTALGRTIAGGFYGPSAGNAMGIALDTINFNDVDRTGWPARFGHLFYSFNDYTVASPLNLDLNVEFDIRIRGGEVRAELYPGHYSGHRVMVGAEINWSETSGRSNQAHFIEIDLAQTNGYGRSYGDPAEPLCVGQFYDRCYYDSNGIFSEGRFVNYQSFLQRSVLPENTEAWTHVVIPLSTVVKQLGWVSKPSDWSRATLTALYFGIESQGATRYWIELKNYRVFSQSR